MLQHLRNVEFRHRLGARDLGIGNGGTARLFAVRAAVHLMPITDRAVSYSAAYELRMRHEYLHTDQEQGSIDRATAEAVKYIGSPHLQAATRGYEAGYDRRSRLIQKAARWRYDLGIRAAFRVNHILGRQTTESG